jgi:hypothetical protein
MFANRVNCFAVRFVNAGWRDGLVINVIVLAAFFLASVPRSAPADGRGKMASSR